MEAMAHFTCVGATVDELRVTLDRMRDEGLDNVLALRGDPPAGPDRVDGHRGRPQLLARADRDDPRRLPVRDRRGVLPRDAHPRDEPRGRPALPQGEGRRRRALPDHAAVLRQRVLLGLRPPAPASWASTSRSSRASCRSPTPARSSASPSCAARRCRRGWWPSSTRARDDPEAVAEFGVAYATLQCADLLEHGAPGIHFYTLNRSPATRAILSALKVFEPWRAATTA